VIALLGRPRPPISNPQSATNPRPSIANPQCSPLPLRFTWGELSGSLGDMGTFLPLVLGVSLACGIDFGAILVWAGLMNMVTGWCFRQPIPVQPMKAIAAVAIAEHLQRGELVAGGTLMGVVLVVLAISGAIGWAGHRSRTCWHSTRAPSSACCWSSPVSRSPPRPATAGAGSISCWSCSRPAGLCCWIRLVAC
jgi:hypothetical protein